MSFPDVIGRKTLGEVLDETPELDSRNDIGGARFNVAWWQLAGCNLMVPRAWVLCDDTGAIVAAAESWNPENDVSMHPTVAQVTTGEYTVTYAATALDHTGTARAIGLRACAVLVQSVTLGDHGVGSVSGGNVGSIYTGSGTTPGDLPFLALFW